MVVECPRCQVRLRYKVSKDNRRLLLIGCPACRARFKVRLNGPVLKLLIAHDDVEIRQQLTERVALLGGSATVCRDESEILQKLQADLSCVLLLDVAFGGYFPFRLIERINTASNAAHKIILLPSVYNHTAYKKRPDSLYGADAYLELHHIGDRLLPLLGELFPLLADRIAKITPVYRHGDERTLEPDDIASQADNLARLLVADIILYHRSRLEQGLESGQLGHLFAEQLAEGRRLLTARLPGVAALPVDFIQQAFDVVCQSHPRSQVL